MTESEDEDKANSHLAPFNPEIKDKDKVPENVEWERRYEERKRCNGGGCSWLLSPSLGRK